MSTLVLVRSQEHIKEKTARALPGFFYQDVKKFFHDVSFLAFLIDDSIVMRDDAALICANQVLSHASNELPLAAYYAELHSKIYQGCSEPSELLSAAKNDARVGKKAIHILRRVVEIDKAIERNGSYTSSQALKKSLLILQKMSQIPPHLQRYRNIEIEYGVDLTDLEMQVLFQVAALGLPCRFILPIDEGQRGFTLPVSYLLSKIESQNNDKISVDLRSIDGENRPSLFLKTLMTNRRVSHEIAESIHVFRAQNPWQEAKWIAGVIAHLKQQQPSVRIAVAYRNFDARTDMLRQALAQQQLPYSMSCGELLSELPCAKLCLYLLEYAGRLVDARTDLRRHPLWRGDDELLTYLSHGIAQQDTFTNWLSYSRDVVTKLNDNSPQQQVLIESIASLEKMDRTNNEITRSDFTKWLKRYWEMQSVPKSAKVFAYDVEIVRLEELLGREVDCVVIADMVHGKLPEIASRDMLLSDDDKFAINLAARKPVLKLFENDPLENSIVQTKQALEPLWWMGACSAARDNVLFTCSKFDEGGKEQANSLFFDAVLLSLGLDPETFFLGHSTFEPLPDALQTRAMLVQLNLSANPAAKRYTQMLKDRTQFFAAHGEKVFAYAFAFQAKELKSQFSNRLGLSKQRPITPTRIEAFADCRFRAFVEKLLMVDTNPDVGNDIDARIVGQIAHGVLEKFYQQVKSNQEIGPSQRDLLRRLLHHEAQLMQLQVTSPKVVFDVMVRWLETALLRLVSNLAKLPPVENVEPAMFEKSMPALPLQIGDETLYFGGVIDRVDEGLHARVVVDYKTSTSASIRQKLAEQNLFVKHFQLPLYARLVEQSDPQDGKNLAAYLVSVRDGTTTQVLGADKMPDFKQRVMDDISEQGLRASLERVMVPVLQGILPADVGVRCDTCRLKRICRVPEDNFSNDVDAMEEVE